LREDLKLFRSNLSFVADKSQDGGIYHHPNLDEESWLGTNIYGID